MPQLSIVNCVLTFLQALMLTNQATFTNCLVKMHPMTKHPDLPSCMTVRSEIVNRFADYIDDVKDKIKSAPGRVSVNWDLWMQDFTSDLYFGMAGQWISVKGKAWTFCAEVLTCHRILGDHSGANLGRHFIRFTDRAGITSKTFSKVYGKYVNVTRLH